MELAAIKDFDDLFSEEVNACSEYDDVVPDCSRSLPGLPRIETQLQIKHANPNPSRSLGSETTCTEEGLPDADWSTKLYIHVMHFPFIDHAHPTSTGKHTPYIHCAIKLTHTLHPLSDQANTHPTSTVRSNKHTPCIHCAIKQTHLHPLCVIKQTHTLHPLCDQANTHPTSTV